MPVPTATRVERSTPSPVERDIERYGQAAALHAAKQGPEQIDRRLAELDAEWDVERALQTNFAVVNAAGVALGALVNPRWYGLSLAATAFMIQHALQGWCPPLPVLRRLNLRTAGEIEQERNALEAMRKGAGRSSNGGTRPLQPQ